MSPVRRRHRPRVGAVAAVALGLALALVVGPAGAAEPTVLLRDVEAGRWRFGSPTEDVQSDTTTEPSIAANPANPLHAVAGYQEGRTDRAGGAVNGFATTFDGGRTWAFGEVPRLTTFNGGTLERASDPVVAFGPGGIVHFSSLVLTIHADGAFHTAIVNSASHDGGLTWDDPVLVHDDEATGYDDKNWVVVDNGDGPGHHKGRVYVVWSRLTIMHVSYSDDDGRSWLAAPSVALNGIGFGAIPLVLPNGDLAVVFNAMVAKPAVDPGPGENLEPATASELQIALAPGAGSVPTGAPLAFLPPVTIAAYEGTDARQQRAGPFLPTADVDERTGRLYVGWSDARHRGDGVNDIVVARSEDGGLTWSAPARVNGGPTGDFVNRFNAALDVGGDGVVRVAYRVRQEAADVAAFSPYVDTEYQESADGESWGPALRVNSLRTDVRFAAVSRDGAFLGDYNQIATSGPLTYVVRCEAYAVDASDIATWPPTVHHQRTWVAVVGPASAATLGAPPVTPGPTAAGSPARAPVQHLPATGAAPAPTAAMALLGAALLLARAARPRRR